MNNFENGTLQNLSKQSIPIDLANQQEMYELKLRVQQLEFLLYLQDKELNEIYEKIYLVTRFLKKKSDRKKLLSILRFMEQRKTSNYLLENRFKASLFSEYGLDRYDGRNLKNKRKNNNDSYNGYDY